MIETVASATGEIVSLDEAKRQLGVWDSADDSRVRLFLEAARNYCERWSETTLRLSATRTTACDRFPAGGWRLGYPPVTGVTSVTYYDSDNASQTWASSNYRVNITQHGVAEVEIDSQATYPVVYDRQDAVTVTYTTGWATAEAAPGDAKAAILLVLSHLYDAGDVKPATAEQSKKAALNLLTGFADPSYR